MRKFIFFLYCLLLAFSSSVWAQFSLFGQSKQHPLPVTDAYELIAAMIHPGVIELTMNIEDSYYLYVDKLSFQPSEGLVLLDEYRESGTPMNDPYFGDVHIWRGSTQAYALLGAHSASANSGELQIHYQGCWDGGLCYPPEYISIPLSDIPQVDAQQWPASLPTVQAAVANTAPPVNRNTLDPLASAAPNVAADPVIAESVIANPVIAKPIASGEPLLAEHLSFIQVLQDQQLMGVVLLFFLAGLALTFTPCVFPMMPILSSLIVGQQTQVSTWRAFGLSLAYVLAMALTYTLIGILAGLFGANLQASFQNPWVISIFALLFAVLSLSMFGYYNLQLPHSWQNKLNNLSRSQSGGQTLSVAIMGVLSALVVGPCMAAPLAGALIYIGQTGDPVLGGLALFSMSVGMGVPLLIVGTSAGRFLPKAGHWMVRVKSAFGVMLLLMAVWMLDRIVPTAVSMALLAVILLFSALYLQLLAHSPESSQGQHLFLKGSGVLLLVYSIALLLGVFSGSNSVIYPLKHLSIAAGSSSSPSAQRLNFDYVLTDLNSLSVVLEQAHANQRPVMLDFYADWCVTCVEMETVTFVDPQVQQGLQNWVTVKLDVTDNSEDSRQLYQRFQVFGPPALVFFDPAGQERRDLAAHGVINASTLLDRINRVL